MIYKTLDFAIIQCLLLLCLDHMLIGIGACARREGEEQKNEKARKLWLYRHALRCIHIVKAPNNY